VSTTQTHAPARTHRPARRLRDEDGIRYGLAHVWLVAVALLAGATGMPRPASFALLVLAALLSGRGLGLRWRVGIALAAWAIWTGFLENSVGILTFTGPDLLRLVILCALAAAVAHLGRGVWARLAP
jgi:hypothetical protein